MKGNSQIYGFIIKTVLFNTDSLFVPIELSLKRTNISKCEFRVAANNQLLKKKMLGISSFEAIKYGGFLHHGSSRTNFIRTECSARKSNRKKALCTGVHEKWPCWQTFDGNVWRKKVWQTWKTDGMSSNSLKLTQVWPLRPVVSAVSVKPGVFGSYLASGYRTASERLTVWPWFYFHNRKVFTEWIRRNRRNIQDEFFLVTAITKVHITGNASLERWRLVSGYRFRHDSWTKNELKEIILGTIELYQVSQT